MILDRCAGRALLLALACAVAGCVAPPPHGAGPGERTIRICHGFGCQFEARLRLTPQDARSFAGHFARASTPQAEREAISRAVRHFEERATQAIGVRDGPRSTPDQAGRIGQMDCIDESENTRALLLHLHAQGLLKHHGVRQNASRGLLLDGRYFHSTAVIGDPDGKSWAVDSWYEPAGGAPDIMPLSQWRMRGVMGAR